VFLVSSLRVLGDPVDCAVRRITKNTESRHKDTKFGFTIFFKAVLITASPSI